MNKDKQVALLNDIILGLKYRVAALTRFEDSGEESAVKREVLNNLIEFEETRLREFVDAVRKAERQACSDVVESVAHRNGLHGFGVVALLDAAAEIRRRK